MPRAGDTRPSLARQRVTAGPFVTWAGHTPLLRVNAGAASPGRPASGTAVTGQGRSTRLQSGPRAQPASSRSAGPFP